MYAPEPADAPGSAASGGGLRNGSEIRAWLTAALAARLGRDPETLDLRRRFRDLGLDSLAAAGLVAELAAALRQTLSPTLAWEHPSPEDLARHLAGEAGPPPEKAAMAAVPTGEPIAVVGLACRLPGAPTPEAFWELLRDGVDATTEAPARFGAPALAAAAAAAAAAGAATAPGRPGAPEDAGAGAWRGGFLPEIDRFDPLAFGISPREAAQMDPQQRLMLELAWEALEDAGIPADGLRGEAGGVFCGAMWSEYGRHDGGGLERITEHTATGQDSSVIAARVSYLLGLEGPSLTVNTACSSSLVAVHLACASLRCGESSLALAGGVNLIVSAASTVAMARFGGLSPDGRSKAFAAGADGYGRGEGGGVVVLKPLSRALADGDFIYCLVRGSAVNNDGFSNGLTAPSRRAQAAVLRRACAAAGVDPAAVAYVEAHGTGTRLGDPIEAAALGEVLGAGRPPERPLLVGSAKTNIGHLEAAAGVAGLIKVALAMQHRQLPASLHCATPNPEIAFAALGLAVQRATTPWPAGDAAPIAGVSSFGFGGTNCHLVLSAPPARPAAPPRPAASPAAALPVFVFSGNGGHWHGMGRELLQRQPAFRAALLGCDRVFRPLAGWSLCDELAAPAERSRLARVDVHQPLLFALQVGLAALWRQWGIVPGAVVGHSAGEVAAAYVAGCLSLEAAVRVIYHRSRLQQRTAGSGAMALAAVPEAVAAAAIAAAGEQDAVVVAALNGPAATVLAGEPGALARVAGSLGAAGARCADLRVDVAYHSPQMDPLAAELPGCLAGLVARAGGVPLASTVTGGLIGGRELDAAYWGRNLRQPVRFAAAVTGLAELGHAAFLELSPHPLLGDAVAATLAAAGRPGRALASLRRGEDGEVTLLGTLAELVDLAAGGEAPAAATPAAWVVTLSAHQPEALRQRARDLAQALPGLAAGGDGGAAGGEDELMRDLAHRTCARRAHLPHRLAAVAAGRRELETLLAAWARGETAAGLAAGRARGTPMAGPVFVFCGQGAERPGMGLGLAAGEEVVRSTLADCDELIRREAGWSLFAELAAPAGRSRLRRTEIAQPALFAVQVALAALWRSWGIEPAAVAGHSAGEVAAAHVAGVLDLETAVRVVCRRGQALAGASGRMAAVDLDPAAAEAHLAGYRGRLAVAAINGPNAVVLAGEEQALDAALAALPAAVGRRPLPVDYAFHGPAAGACGAALAAALAGLAGRPARLPLASTVTGGLLSGPELDAAHWQLSVAGPVRFAAAVSALIDRGAGDFLEIGPHPVLARPLRQLLAAHARDGLALPTLRRGAEERRTALGSLGVLYTAGAEIDWAAVVPAGGRLPLPAYPWQRRRCWLEAEEQAPAAAGMPGRGAGAPAGRTERVSGPAATAVSGPAATATPSGLDRAALLALPAGARAERLAASLRRLVAAALEIAPEELDPELPLVRLGLDSFTAVKVTHRIEQDLGAYVPEFDLLEEMSLAGVISEVLRELAPAVPAAAAAAAETGAAPGGWETGEL